VNEGSLSAEVATQSDCGKIDRQSHCGRVQYRATKYQSSAPEKPGWIAGWARDLISWIGDNYFLYRNISGWCQIFRCWRINCKA